MDKGFDRIPYKIWERYSELNDGYSYLQWQYSAPTQQAIPENVQISISVTIT
jgi:hypothetical protein